VKSNPLNILLITQEDILAGSSFSVSYLAEALAARGHKVLVAARPMSVLQGLLADSTSVIFVPFVIKSRFDRKAIRHLKSIVEEHQIEVINAQSSKDRYITIFARMFYGVRALLFHTRRQYPLSAGGFLQNSFYVKGTDKIILISHELKRIFIKKGYPDKHLKVIHNGIPVSRYNQWNEQDVVELKQLYGIQTGDLVVGSISRLKRHEQLIWAIKDLAMPNVKVLLVGVKEGHFDTLCTELGITNQVIYAGEVVPEKVLNYYKLLTVNILPSITDGFGLVLLESMAMGCPVVATRFGGILDVVQHKENGLLFDDGDYHQLAVHIKSVLYDLDLRNALIQKGFVTIQTFTMNNTTRNYETFFEEQIASALTRLKG